MLCTLDTSITSAMPSKSLKASRSWLRFPSLATGWKKGVKQISNMNKGGTQTVGDIRVTMVHADHSCGITDGDQIVYGGEACGYVIEWLTG